MGFEEGKSKAHMKALNEACGFLLRRGESWIMVGFWGNGEPAIWQREQPWVRQQVLQQTQKVKGQRLKVLRNISFFICPMGQFHHLMKRNIYVQSFQDQGFSSRPQANSILTCLTGFWKSAINNNPPFTKEADNSGPVMYNATKRIKCKAVSDQINSACSFYDNELRYGAWPYQLNTQKMINLQKNVWK